jgi:Flp pilus assembly protein TadD
MATLAPALLPAAARAQTAPAPAAAVPPELSDEARKAHAQGLKDAREAIARKQYAVATTRLDGLLAQRPREPQARFLKGVVQTETGDTAAAIATFRALTEDFPELPEPWNNLAVIEAQQGDWNGARLALESALATAPDWPVAHENLGDVYARLAAIHYERAATLDRDNRSAAAKLTLARELLATRPAPPAAAAAAKR